ncbi:MAG: bifunctional methylenetetrahydrofolate dehydrogenase/methenyltetrahydrofolate cyclohydrolase FolD [Weeksellaceae bacterium]|nr:bifunctional methylenetetrahydrofolate dehydrogenase/methenyltetrahydrofolate cyclohydrolase FolD [Weeksellaceae bacterium]
MQLIDGNKISKEIRDEIQVEVKKWTDKGERKPHLAAVLVGDNPASQSYVKNKIKDCKSVGFESSLHKLDENVTEEELLALVEKLNNQEGLDGYIVQLPLPKHLDEEKITLAINPEKDADGFHPTNIGKMVLDMPTFLPATPYGIMELLDRSNIPTEGKHCVVIGRSNIVGRPMSVLMSRKSNPGNATVTLCHSRTPNIEEFTRKADIVIVALGKPYYLKKDMIQEGTTVIDVGINRVRDSDTGKNKLVGDVDFDEVKDRADHITPVPGGVGPMTRAMLLKNTLLAYERNISSEKN